MTKGTSRGKAYPLFAPTPRRVALALGVASGTVLSAGAAYVLGGLVDGIASGALAPGETVARLAAYLAVTLAAALAKFLLDDWLPMRENLWAELDASKDAVDKVLALSQRAFERHDAGHLLTAVNEAAFGCGSMLVYLTVNVVGCLIASVALLACAAAIDVVLVPVFLVGFALYFVVNWAPAREASRLLVEMVPARDAWKEEIRRVVEEKRAANASGAEGFYAERFAGCAREYQARRCRQGVADCVQTALPTAISPALQVVVLAVCAALWSTGAVTLGAAVAAWQLFSLVQAPMAECCSLVSFCVAMRGNLDLLRELAAEAAEPSGFEALAAGEKDLVARVDGTLWATPERGEDGKRLWAGSFDVRPGELVVVRGANGTGKSRLLDFLRGLSDPADLDGEAQLSSQALGAAYLTYPVPVVPGTLGDNLLGQAAGPEVARVLDLGDLPERAITDQPLNLSLGERQKLGLLRALSRPEPVVLLDEPLANLDEGARSRLCSYLAGLRGSRTMVAIMHSDDLDAAADRIYEVRDGRLERVR